MLPTVSILIAAKNEEKVIEKCLDSVLNCEYPKDKLEILVNVNGSSDNTYEICKKYKKVKTIKTPAKSCRGQALNELIDLCKGEIIGIFDADTVVDKRCLKRAVKRFSDKNVMGVAGLVKSLKNNAISRAISIERDLVSFLEYIITHKIGQNAHFTGPNMFVRKIVFDKVGKLDEYTDIDDIELSLRMKEHNYKVVFEPKAVVWQYEPNSISSFFKQRTSWARSSLRMKKLKKQRKIKHWINDMSHFLAPAVFSVSLFSLILFSVFIMFNFQTITIITAFILFSFTVMIVSYSKIVYEEPISDILFFPFWLFLNSLFVFFIYPKGFIQEMKDEQYKWHDIKK